MNNGIDIIIINYFSTSKVLSLLQSINNSDIDQTLIHTIIISNSQEKELDIFENNKQITLIKNDTNLGFGTACNKAIPYCRHKYVLLLNPDTNLFPETLKASYQFLEEFLDITVLGIKHLNTDGRVALSCSRFPSIKNYFFEMIGFSKINPKIFHGGSLMADFNHLTSRYVNQVMGAFMLIRKSYIDAYGFMDERFFVFGEDMDFCKKVWLNKHKVYYNANIEIVHEGGSSSNNIGGKKLCYMLEGKLKYAHKYFSTTAWITLLLMVILLEPVMRLIWSIITLNFKKIAETFEGYFLFFKRRQFK